MKEEKIEEIKRGLKVCSEGVVCGLSDGQCPYVKYTSQTCISHLAKDALELINELSKKKG